MDSQKPDKPRHPLEAPLDSQGRDDIPWATMTAPPRRQPRDDANYVSLPLVQPVFTYAILITNLIIFLADNLLFHGLLLEYGALYKPAVQAGEFWRLLTAIFLHLDLGHILANSLGLWIIGTQVERAYGYTRFLLLYFLTGLAGSAVALFFYEGSAGASGAIEGLMGGLLMLLVLNRRIFANPTFYIFRLLFSLVIQLAAVTNIAGRTDVPNIGYWAHLGGAALGILLGWRIAPIFRPVVGPTGRIESIVDVRPTDILWPIAALAMIGILALSFAAVWLFS
jgi:membrane associated rhomboid family serine protease